MKGEPNQVPEPTSALAPGRRASPTSGKSMNKTISSPFLRPLVGALGFLGFFCLYIPAKGRALTLANVGVVGGWLLLSTLIVGVVQIVRKQTWGWIASIAGVVILTVLISALMVSVKTGQFITR